MTCASSENCVLSVVFITRTFFLIFHVQDRDYMLVYVDVGFTFVYKFYIVL